MNVKKNLYQLLTVLCAVAALSSPAFAEASESLLKEIPFNDIDGVRVGNAQNEKGKTGVTVLVFPKGAKAGVDISGGGPA